MPFFQAPTTLTVECNACPAGYYCDETIGMRVVCPAGYFCPEGTGADWQACPRGTYSNTTGLHNSSQCTPCDAGKYCGTEHLTQPTGEIHEIIVSIFY
ncbi:hypothetical protein DPMN_185101 [Dreissena polymorpha]|uniref:Tyrosine-protein kinase ephrin type A/B receptor-like domain-containing protein n=1 Tax=Dreissena polymorpha TaxID=45954 RepID=A0A9D4DN00_DREPO|nr:hypothetical protein DPMN_185101 [Dreissena polymorpha]